MEEKFAHSGFAPGARRLPKVRRCREFSLLAKQPVCGARKTLVRASRVVHMPDQLARRAIDVGPFKVIEPARSASQRRLSVVVRSR